jgi:CheY-like chemotaxis protein
MKPAGARRARPDVPRRTLDGTKRGSPRCKQAARTQAPRRPHDQEHIMKPTDTPTPASPAIASPATASPATASPATASSAAAPPAATSTAASPTAPRPLRLLLVEDAATDAELLLSRFKRLGYRVDSRRVWTEETFSEALAGFAPELIVSDHSMPTFDGLRALGLARAAAPGVPFIFISGTIDAARSAAARAAGAAECLPKDDLGSLGAVLERALGAAPGTGKGAA